MLESILSDVERNEKKMEDFESHEYKVGFKNAIARIKKDILDTEIDDVIRDE